MKKYNIHRIVYQDNYGKDIKLHVQGIELIDNTEEFAGYWDICLGKIKDFSLNEGDKSIFIFETDKGAQLIGEGYVQCDGKGGYNLNGEIIKLK